jgi:hypothetical protein
MPATPAVWRPVAPLTRARMSSSRPQCPTYLTPPRIRLVPLPASRAPAAAATPLRRAELAGDARSSHASPQATTTPSLRLRFSLAQPMLTLASRGKASSDGYCSSELNAPRRRAPLRGPRSSASPLTPFSHASEPLRSPGARTPLPAPHRGWRHAPASEPSHRAAMVDGELDFELL